MKFPVKTVFLIMFLLSMFLSYCFYLNYDNHSQKIELISENNLTFNGFGFYSESDEDDEATNESKFLPTVGIPEREYHFQNNYQRTQSCFSIWHPPRII